MQSGNSDTGMQRIDLMSVYKVCRLNLNYLHVFCHVFQVHFRAYPTELLSPCEGEEAVKWSFINSMKEVG